MEWTSEWPSVPGLYWHAYPGSGGRELRIVEFVESKGETFLRQFGYDGGLMEPLKHHWQFHGPIEPPPLPKEERET